MEDVRWLLQSVRPELWLEAIGYWSAWMISSGVRPRTVELRRYQLGCLAAAHLNRSPWSLSTNDLVVWQAGHRWAPETRKSYRSALRSFYRWGLVAGETKHDPTAGLPTVRTSSPPPRPAPDQALAQALAGATDRDKLLVLLAAYAGLRRAEIAGLLWSDVSAAALRVEGKGGRVRVVPLHPLLADRLAAERIRRQSGYTGTGYRYSCSGCGCVFPGQKGASMTPGAVGKAITRLLPEGWTGHTLRHRFATRAYAGSRDLLAVQALLGHTKPETTKRYTELADDSLAAAVLSV